MVPPLVAGGLIGAAMLLPSISAATMALITGHYDRLLQLVNKWRHILSNPSANAESISFAVKVALGAGLAVAALAPFLNFILSSHPGLLKAFFAGLLFATAASFAPSRESLATSDIAPATAGVSAVLGLTLLNASIPTTLIYAPFLAVIAVTAMFLPGLSGSYTLLVLGAYEHLIDTIANPFENLPYIAIFGVTGIIYAEQYAGILHATFTDHRRLARTVVFGLLIGGAIHLLAGVPITMGAGTACLGGIATYFTPLLQRVKSGP